MKKRAVGRLFVAARLFLACTTMLLLTATVMQVEDRDGYQATHLFFMPRESWEMDQGRGMLHDEDYYREMDLEEFTGGDGDSAGLHDPDLYTQSASNATAGNQDGENTLMDQHRGPISVRRLPHSPTPPGNEVPTVLQVAEPSISYPWQPSGCMADSLLSTAWQADVPSPPPRESTLATT